jgi:hypothetical protein
MQMIPLSPTETLVREIAFYSPGPLGSNEVSLRSFARRMRELIPESRLEHAPRPGWRTGSALGTHRG